MRLFLSSAQQRILAITRLEDGHWIYCGPAKIRPNGYAPRGSDHKASYERFIGPVPEGKELDHTCKIKLCLYPWHLEPVSHAENMSRHYGFQVYSKPTDEEVRRAVELF